MSVQNTVLTDAVIAKDSMMVFHNSIAFLKGVNRQYSKEFAQTGAKIGTTINVKKANRYVVQQGPTITPQGTSEATVPLTLNRYWTIPMTFSGVERTLMIDQFRKNYILPAINKMTGQMDYECAGAAATGLYPTANSAGSYACPGAGPVNMVIGTPGTTPGTPGGSIAAGTITVYNAPTIFLNAGRLLDDQCCPDDGRRTFCMNSAANAASIGSLAGLFNPQGLISDQYKKGLMGNALTFDFIKDQAIYTFTAGTRVATGVTTVQATWVTATGANLLVTGGSTTIAAGDSFYVGTGGGAANSVMTVNPETQQSTGIPMQFTVTAAITLSGTTTLQIAPTPVVAAAGVANGNIDRAPTASDTINFTSGAASTVSPQNMAYHEDAFTLGTADLELPNNAGGGSVTYAARENFDGVSMRIVTFWDGISDQHITRLDVLGGFSVQRPEWAVRVAG